MADLEMLDVASTGIGSPGQERIAELSIEEELDQQ